MTWDVGKINPQKLPSLKGTMSLQAGASKPDENPTINIQFKIQQMAISGTHTHISKQLVLMQPQSSVFFFVGIAVCPWNCLSNTLMLTLTHFVSTQWTFVFSVSRSGTLRFIVLIACSADNHLTVPLSEHSDHWPLDGAKCNKYTMSESARCSVGTFDILLQTLSWVPHVFPRPPSMIWCMRLVGPLLDWAQTYVTTCYNFVKTRYSSWGL